jgi:hypothetical protein
MSRIQFGWLICASACSTLASSSQKSDIVTPPEAIMLALNPDMVTRNDR